MRDRTKKAEAYRYRPPSPTGKEALGPEESRERYYLLIRMGIPPESLRKVSWVNIAVVVCVLGMFFLGALLLPKPTVSQVEKRDLAKRPAFSVEALFSGGFTREMEVYYADTFPLREWMVGLSAVVEESFGVRMDDVRIIHNDGMNEVSDITKAPVQTAPPAQPAPAPAPSSETEEPSSAAESVSEPTTPPPPADDGAGEASTISNGILVYKGRAMSLFGGLESNGTWYAETLNAYRAELPGVQIYNMIIPTAGEFYVPERYRDISQSQKKMIDHIYSELDPAIRRVDALGALAQHTDEYLYFRTDHHWTGLGAYYAYTAFCEQAGITPLELSDFETRRLDDFIGTMYAQSQDSSLLEQPDYVDYYLFNQSYEAERFMPGAPGYAIPHKLWGEYATGANSYSVFLQGDFPLIQVRTGANNGRKIMVVKESFGNAFAPFLINHYEEVYIVDQRYFQLGAIDFIKEHGINELIFANNAFAACTPYHIRCIDGLRHQVFVPAPPAPPAEPETSSSEDEEEEQKPKKKTSAKKNAEKSAQDETDD